MLNILTAVKLTYNLCISFHLLCVTIRIIITQINARMVNNKTFSLALNYQTSTNNCCFFSVCTSLSSKPDLIFLVWYPTVKGKALRV